MSMNRKIIDRIASASIPIAIAILSAYIYFVTTLSNNTEMSSHAVESLLSPHLATFQDLFPINSIIVSILFFITGAMLNVMLATRYNLFTTSTQLPLLFYICFVVGFSTSSDTLASALAACLMTLSMRDLFRTYESNGRTSKLFSGCFWMGLLPLIYPATITLWIAPFLFLILFVKSLREISVVICGLILPLAIYTYLQWLWGGEFVAPILHLFGSIAERFSYPSTLDSDILRCHTILGSVTALLGFISLLQVERMSLRFVARTRLYCTFITVILGVFMLILPSYSSQVATTLAAPL